MKRSLKLSSFIAASSLILVGLSTSTAQAQAYLNTPNFANPPAAIGSCHDVTIPVTLPNHSPAQLHGHMCTPRWGQPHTVQLLLHGGTYNASYWSWPQDPQFRSYVWAALGAGYAVLALDRLGYGESTRPSSDQVTFAAQAETLHTVVTDLKDGHFWFHYRSVIGVGHSFGSAELINQNAVYPHDYSALILTGSGSKVSTVTRGLTFTEQSPANTVAPEHFGNLDNGYLTSPSVQDRIDLVYTPQDAKLSTIKFDFKTEDTLTTGEINSRPATLNADEALIKIPTLLLDGQDDTHYCNGATPEFDLDNCSTPAGLYASEKPNYSQACFATSVVPHSGHDLTLEDGAASATRLMLEWSLATAPRNGNTPHCTMTGGMN